MASDDEAHSKVSRFKTHRTMTLSFVPPLSYRRMRSFPFFESCTEAFLVLLAQELALRIFQPGQKILVQGEFGEMTYILVHGEVEVSGGLGSLVAPAMFGESPLLKACPARRTATVTAKEVCDCRVIHQRMFNKLLDRFPDERLAYHKMAKERGILKDEPTVTWTHSGRRSERSPPSCPAYVGPYRSCFEKLSERIMEDKATGKNTPRAVQPIPKLIRLKRPSPQRNLLALLPFTSLA
eukprot:TRINITY_DN24115_c0_g1_i2.p1 TRINITY_DN24115_c0_g1~~TRINITY_DN24115_c0_g1_i2.p1  ORF type:complete len:238 (-),score=21.20 TRINITY_DN24115_c0_g1_i2:189-902(-)